MTKGAGPLRGVVPVVLAVLALVNTLLVLEGRSGYLVALTAIALAIMWSMPRHLRLAALVVTPFVLFLGLTLGSAKVQERVTKVFQESQGFAQTHQVSAKDSSAFRLNAWMQSVQAMQEKPLVGHGVGNWTPVVKRIQGSEADAVQAAGETIPGDDGAAVAIPDDGKADTAGDESIMDDEYISFGGKE